MKIVIPLVEIQALVAPVVQFIGLSACMDPRGAHYGLFAVGDGPVAGLRAISSHNSPVPLFCFEFSLECDAHIGI